MPIEVANTLDEVDDDDFKESDAGDEYNMRELMDMLYEQRDFIVTMPTEQIPILKAGLIARKGKDNRKLKKNDLKVASEVLSFLVLPAKDKDGAERVGLSDVRIKLGPKKSVQILEIRMPNDEF